MSASVDVFDSDPRTETLSGHGDNVKTRETEAEGKLGRREKEERKRKRAADAGGSKGKRGSHPENPCQTPTATAAACLTPHEEDGDRC